MQYIIQFTINVTTRQRVPIVSVCSGRRLLTDCQSHIGRSVSRHTLYVRPIARCELVRSLTGHCGVAASHQIYFRPKHIRYIK